jgi:hypothetical protein
MNEVVNSPSATACLGTVRQLVVLDRIDTPPVSKRDAEVGAITRRHSKQRDFTVVAAATIAAAAVMGG